MPTGSARVSWLDARDIAAAAAALVLASPADRKLFEGTAWELSGPRAHTAAEMADILSLVARHPIEHVDGVEPFSAHCKALGAPDVAKHFYGEAAGGWFAKVDDELFVKLLGRHTTSFTRFAMDRTSRTSAAAEATEGRPRLQASRVWRKILASPHTDSTFS